MAKINLELYIKLEVSIDFSTQISLNSLASGAEGSAPEPPTNAYF